MANADRTHQGLSERQVAHLLESGRISAAEASILSSGDDGERAAVLGAIRSRHAAERLADAVAAGTLSAAEAEELVREVREGGHDPSLRRRVNRAARRQSPGAEGPA